MTLDRQMFAKGFARMLTVWPERTIGMTPDEIREQTRARADTYYKAVCTLTQEAFDYAVEHLCAEDTGRELPKPAAILMHGRSWQLQHPESDVRYLPQIESDDDPVLRKLEFIVRHHPPKGLAFSTEGQLAYLHKVALLGGLITDADDAVKEMPRMREVGEEG